MTDRHERMMGEGIVLLLVDLQAGAFGGGGIPPAHDGDVLLDRAAALLRAARASGVPVVHVQHCAPPGEVFEEGAPGWPIAPRLMPGAGERTVRKRASNAFEGTELHDVLGALGARQVVVTGIQSEHCVAATCRGALRLGYGVRLAEDGHSTWPDAARTAPEIIAGENQALERDGVTLTPTERLVEWLRARPSPR
jgi:nicotinamidase-related amidase